MKRVFWAVSIALAACTDKPAENERAVQADTMQVDSMAAATTAADTASKSRGTPVDGSTLKVGDQVAGMQLVENNVQAAPQSTTGVTGSLKFRGEVEVTGGYRAHFEYPEVKEPCFWVDPGDWKKLPRQKGDERVVWFCFTNPQEAITKLGALGTETRATIVIDDYTTNLQQSDVWDQARLVRVVKKGNMP